MVASRNLQWKRVLVLFFGKHLRSIMRPVRTDEFLDTSTADWCLFARTRPTHIDLDFSEHFWQDDKNWRMKFGYLTNELANGSIPVSVCTTDLLCIKIKKEWVQLALDIDGWHILTIADMMEYDHWLIAEGSI